MSREIIAQFAGVRRRIPDLDQLVVRWILECGRDFDILALIHLENRQLGRAGDRPFVAEYLVVPENALVESASLVEVIRLHDEIILAIGGLGAEAAVNSMIPKTAGIKRKSARIG